MRLLGFTGKGSLVLLAPTVVSALIEAAEPKPRPLLAPSLRLAEMQVAPIDLIDDRC